MDPDIKSFPEPSKFQILIVSSMATGFSELRNQVYTKRQIVKATLEDPSVNLATMDAKTRMTVCT